MNEAEEEVVNVSEDVVGHDDKDALVEVLSLDGEQVFAPSL